MFRLTLNQMRASLPRLVAAGVAIIIGTTFAALTFMVGGAMTAITNAQLAAQYANADVVVRVENQLTTNELQALRALPQVVAADPMLAGWGELGFGGRSVWQEVRPTPSSLSLGPFELVDGEWPTQTGEIALDAQVADRIGIVPGAQVDWLPVTYIEVEPGVYSTMSAETAQPMLVTGIITDPFGAFAASGGVALVSQADLTGWMGTADGTLTTAEAAAALTPEAARDLPAAREAIAEAFAAAGTQTQVFTPAEHADQVAAAMMGGDNLIFTVFVGVFAAIALLMAGLVIANTFQVLVAQRTRDLALLRAVGAGAAQIRNSVLLEALVLGLAASLLGAGLGVALANGALAVARGLNLRFALPAVIPVTVWTIAGPVLVGALVTVAAALTPARVATRVAPLAALRPLDAPDARRRAGKVRLVLALLAVAGGFALLLAALNLSRAGDPSALTSAIMLAVAGCVISFIGLVVSAVFWLPAVVGHVGNLVGRTGPTAKLAAANTLRNPRRTASTATALMIGTTLIATMATGAATASATLNNLLDGAIPVDVIVATDFWVPAGTADPLPSYLVAEIQALDGVRAAVVVPGATVSVTDADGFTYPGPVEVRGLSDAALAVLRDRSGFADLSPTTAVLPPGVLPGGEVWDDRGGPDGGQALQARPMQTGDHITLTGPAGSITLTAVRAPLPGEQAIIVTADVFAQIAGEPSFGAPGGAGGAPMGSGGAQGASAGIGDEAQGEPLDDGVAPGFPGGADGGAVGQGASASRLWVALDDVTDAGRVVPLISDLVADSLVPAAVQGFAVERAQVQRVIDTALTVVVALLGSAVVIALIGVANTLSLSVIERARESATLRAIGLSRGGLRGMLAAEGVLIAVVGAGVGVLFGLVYGSAGAATILGATGRVSLAVPWGYVAAALAIALGAGLLASVLPGRHAANQPPVAALAAH